MSHEPVVMDTGQHNITSRIVNDIITTVHYYVAIVVFLALRAPTFILFANHGAIACRRPTTPRVDSSNNNNNISI